MEEFNHKYDALNKSVVLVDKYGLLPVYRYWYDLLLNSYSESEIPFDEYSKGYQEGYRGDFNKLYIDTPDLRKQNIINLLSDNNSGLKRGFPFVIIGEEKQHLIPNLFYEYGLRVGLEKKAWEQVFSHPEYYIDFINDRFDNGKGISSEENQAEKSPTDDINQSHEICLTKEQIIKLIKEKVMKKGTFSEFNIDENVHGDNPDYTFDMSFGDSDDYYLIKSDVYYDCRNKIWNLLNVKVYGVAAKYEKNVNSFISLMNFSTIELKEYIKEEKKKMWVQIGENIFGNSIDFSDDYNEQINCAFKGLIRKNTQEIIGNVYFPVVEQVKIKTAIPGVKESFTRTSANNFISFFDKEEVQEIQELYVHIKNIEYLNELDNELLSQTSNSYYQKVHHEDQIEIPMIATIVNKYVLLDQLGMIQLLKDKFQFDSLNREKQTALLSMILGLDNKAGESIRKILSSLTPNHKNYPLKEGNINSIWSELTKLGIAKPSKTEDF